MPIIYRLNFQTIHFLVLAGNTIQLCYYLLLVFTCHDVRDIHYGYTNCVHAHGDSVMAIGDNCTFSCSPGFKLIGANTVHCTKAGYDNDLPICQGEDLGNYVVLNVRRS